MAYCMQDYLPRLCDESADRLPISGVPSLLLSGLDIVFKNNRISSQSEDKKASQFACTQKSDSRICQSDKFIRDAQKLKENN